MQVPLVTFSPRAQAAAIQASAQAGQPNGTGQAGHQTATLNPGSLRLDPLGRPMSIDHEHQVCVSMLPGLPSTTIMLSQDSTVPYLLHHTGLA